MRILIATHGSRGDSQPAVALGLELQKHGHFVTVANCEDQRDFVLRYGINDFYGFRATTDQFFEASKDFLIGNFDYLAMRSKRKDVYLDLCSDRPHQVVEAAKDKDFIIYHISLEIEAHTASQYYGIPAVAFHLIPWCRTKDFPPPVVNPTTLPEGTDFAALWDKVVDGSWEDYKRDQINELRAGLNLPPITSNPLKQLVGHSKSVTCFSSHIVPRPEDWPEQIVQGGPLTLTSSSGLSPWEPSEDLLQFLNAGPEPIYIGFGSMIRKDPEHLLDLVLNVLKRTGNRAIICEGWFTLKKPEGFDPLAHGLTQDQVFFVKDVPHSWLLPKCSLIISHGGAGTTAASVMSRKPIVICPFLIDQPFWSYQLIKLGVSPGPILNATTMTADELESAVTRALSDDEMKRKAQELGDLVANENGTEKVIQAFLSLIASPPPIFHFV